MLNFTALLLSHTSICHSWLQLSDRIKGCYTQKALSGLSWQKFEIIYNISTMFQRFRLLCLFFSRKPVLCWNCRWESLISLCTHTVSGKAFPKDCMPQLNLIILIGRIYKRNMHQQTEWKIISILDTGSMQLYCTTLLMAMKIHTSASTAFKKYLIHDYWKFKTWREP